jgi:hypothetical protein
MKLVNTKTAFSSVELERVKRSLLNVLDTPEAWDWSSLLELLQRSAHLSHKDWIVTEKYAADLAAIIGGPGIPSFDRVFEHVIECGRWATAACFAQNRINHHHRLPWVVLITGVNGIRKTSSVYQPWFQEALKIALGNTYDGETSDLPCGTNTFFRQLDYMVATVANEDFRALYEEYEDDIGTYASRKNAIFTRYRMFAEQVYTIIAYLKLFPHT